MVKLGSKVKDSLTKLQGIATARTDYMYGCSRICVEWFDKKTGSILEVWLDEQRLTSKPKARSGGGSNPTSRSIPK